MTSIESAYSAYIQQRQQNGLFRELITLDQAAVREIVVQNRTYINLCSNDYLGLRYHPELIERAQAWTAHYGAGSGASRLVTGNLDVFSRLEGKIAALKEQPAALIFASGFQANASIIQALLDQRVLDGEPLIFADKLNHASMHFGCAAAGVRQIRYRHLDLDHLEMLLCRNGETKGPRFILTESVFSMDGDITPMEEIAELAKKYGCFVICDDAHGTGVLGTGGRGLSQGADLVIGTFSKALGSFGAYVACSETLQSYLINRCSGLIYSTALPPAVLGAIDAALDLLPILDKERQRVANLASHFREETQKLGFDTGRSATQIVPLIVGTSEQARELSIWLKDHGFWAAAIRPPTVPVGTARLRFAFSSAHQMDDIDSLVDALASWPSRENLLHSKDGNKAAT